MIGFRLGFEWSLGCRVLNLGLGIYYFDERVLVTPNPQGYSSDVIVTGHLCEAGWEPKSAHYHGGIGEWVPGMTLAARARMIERPVSGFRV